MVLTTARNTVMYPVIDFEVLVDVDLAVVKYCVLHQMDNIIDYEGIKKLSYFDLVAKLYNRKCINPLKVVAKPGVTDIELDNLYNEVMSNHEAEVLDGARLTDVFRMLKEFVKTVDITPYIWCHSDAQKAILASSSLRNIPIVNTEEARVKKTQYYLKTIDRIKEFSEVKSATFYISTMGINLNEDNDDLDIDRDEVVAVALNQGAISVFDMYNATIIKRS